MRVTFDINTRNAVLMGVLSISAMLPFQVRAALGEPESTVGDDAQHFRATVKSTSRTGYRVHEIQLASGTLLREFAVEGGSVFAVTWNGPSIPDLRQALGGYFDVYVAASAQKRGGHSHVEIRQDGLVVQSSGHMRAFTGRAYVVQAMPSGMTMEELR